MTVGVLALLFAIGTAWCLPAGAVLLEPGDLVVVDAGAAAPAVPARVIRIDPASGAQEVVSSAGYLTEPLAIAVEPSGTLLVADGSDGAAAVLVRIEPSNGAQTLLGSAAPVGLAVDSADGSVYVTDGLGASVLAVDPLTGATTPVTSGLPLHFAQSIAIGADGKLYVADFDVAWDVVRVDPAGGSATPLAAAPLSFVGALAASAGSLWVTQPEDDAIVRIATANGDVSPVASGDELRFPFGVAIEADGALVVADWGDTEVGPAIVRVDPANGNQAIVAQAGFLTEPWGIAVVAPEPASHLGAFIGFGVVLLLRLVRLRA
jgi:DNA-binding beta-propeller fold protein YncE